MNVMINPPGGTGAMHTFWVRLNAVVFFGFTVLLCLSVLTAVR
jgi:hypothetical protein